MLMYYIMGFILAIVLLVGQFAVLFFINFIAVMSFNEWLQKRRDKKKNLKNNKEV